MYLEGIIVCVNYSDFLVHTLPHNKTHFNNLIVVTDTKDLKTKKVCDYFHVRCLQTDIFYEKNNSFNKGAAINYGLQHLSKQDWVVHLDADIYLPPLTRTILENLPLQKQKIYGIDRLMCPNYEQWINFLNLPKPIQDSWIYIHLDAFPIGVRIAEYMNKNAGYEPIGYFQLWNPAESNVYDYPTEHDFCDRTDVLHCKKFARENRELLPELVAIHLDSEYLPEMGKNWKGRKTKLFLPDDSCKNEFDEDIHRINQQLYTLLQKYNLDTISASVTNYKTSPLRCLFNRFRSTVRRFRLNHKKCIVSYR